MNGDGRQLDLFTWDGSERAAAPTDVEGLDDAALIGALPDARGAGCRALVDEAVRRRPVGVVAALEALCRRHKGFGLGRVVAEQVEALRGLELVGGGEAGKAVTRIIEQQVVQGPGLEHAVGAAARLGAGLRGETVLALLRDAAPGVRAHACRCVRGGRETVEVLIELLGDLHGQVATAAALVLGRMGRDEARLALMRLLAEAPSVEVIEAIAGVADEDVIPMLRRAAVRDPALIEVVVAALEEIGGPRAGAVIVGIRGGAV